jgi:hypothetical protein
VIIDVLVHFWYRYIKYITQREKGEMKIRAKHSDRDSEILVHNNNIIGIIPNINMPHATLKCLPATHSIQRNNLINFINIGIL